MIRATLNRRSVERLRQFIPALKSDCNVNDLVWKNDCSFSSSRQFLNISSNGPSSIVISSWNGTTTFTSRRTFSSDSRENPSEHTDFASYESHTDTTTSFSDSMSKIFPGSSSPIPPETTDIPATDLTTDITTDVSTTVFEPTWYPADLMIQTLSSIHSFTGLPYAYTIIATTLLIHTALVPLFITSQRNTSRMAHMKPEMDVLKAKIDKLSSSTTSREQHVEMTKQMRALFAKYECDPLKGLIYPLVQIPLVVSMFFGLEKMPQFFSDDLAVGGMLWFSDLTVPDPYMALPVLSALSFLATIEITNDTIMQAQWNPAQGKKTINVMRGFFVFMIPATMSFDAAFFVYWITHNVFSLGLTAAFQNKKVRKMFDIWDPPKPVSGGDGKVKGIGEYVSGMMKERKVNQAKDEEKERIERVNKEVEEKKMKRMARRKRRSSR